MCIYVCVHVCFYSHILLFIYIARFILHVQLLADPAFSTIGSVLLHVSCLFNHSVKCDHMRI